MVKAGLRFIQLSLMVCFVDKCDRCHKNCEFSYRPIDDFWRYLTSAELLKKVAIKLVYTHFSHNQRMYILITFVLEFYHCISQQQKMVDSKLVKQTKVSDYECDDNCFLFSTATCFQGASTGKLNLICTGIGFKKLCLHTVGLYFIIMIRV